MQHSSKMIMALSAIVGLALALQIIFGSLVIGQAQTAAGLDPQQKVNTGLGLFFAALSFVMLIAVWIIQYKNLAQALLLLEITLIPIQIATTLFFTSLRTSGAAILTGGSTTTADSYLLVAGILGLIAFILAVVHVFALQSHTLMGTRVEKVIELKSLAKATSPKRQTKSPSRSRSRS